MLQEQGYNEDGGAFSGEQALFLGMAESESFETLVARGVSSRGRVDHADALQCFTRAAELQPQHVGVQLEIALSLVDLSRFREAQHIYRNLLIAEPHCAAALVGMGHISRRRQAHERALEWFKLAAAAEPENLEIQSELAAELLSLARYSDAEMIYCGILEKNPRHFCGLLGVALALRRRGRRSEALAIFYDLLHQNPDMAGLLHEIGQTLKDMKRLDEAREIYQRIIMLHPNDQHAKLLLAQLGEAGQRLATAA